MNILDFCEVQRMWKLKVEWEDFRFQQDSENVENEGSRF